MKPLDSCEVVECMDLIHCQTFCKNHYGMWQLHGTPTPAKVCVTCSKEYVFLGLKLGSNLAHCPDCQSLRALYPTRVYERHGLNVLQYHDMFLQQGYACKICGAKPKRLELDHDRNCCGSNSRVLSRRSCGGCIRGLLCGNCNSMIGHYESVRERLKIDQFEEYRSVRWRNIRGRMVKQYVTVAV